MANQSPDLSTALRRAHLALLSWPHWGLQGLSLYLRVGSLASFSPHWVTVTESVSPRNSSRKLLWKLAVGVLGRMRWEASWLMQEAWSRALAAPIKPQSFSPDICVPECGGSRHPAPFLFNSSLEERRESSPLGLGEAESSWSPTNLGSELVEPQPWMPAVQVAEIIPIAKDWTKC